MLSTTALIEMQVVRADKSYRYVGQYHRCLFIAAAASMILEFGLAHTRLAGTAVRQRLGHARPDKQRAQRICI